MIVIGKKNASKLVGYKFIDLFAGIGGFRMALESFGAECMFTSEKNRYARETYWENFDVVPKGDITRIKEEDIPRHNILCAGFPCQPFSSSGRLKGFDDTRGTLFFNIAKIAKHHQPDILFLENVSNLKSHDRGRTLEVIVRTLDEVGYAVFHAILDAGNFGVPQSRKRIYILGFNKRLKVSDFNFPEPTKIPVSLDDILLSDSDVAKYIIDKEIGPMAAADGLFYLDGSARRFAPRECARLMGFPDTFEINARKAQAYKQFGNSVVVNVLQYIVLEIIRAKIADRMRKV